MLDDIAFRRLGLPAEPREKRRGSGESQLEDSAHEQPEPSHEDWEVPELRMHMPRELQQELNAVTAVVTVSRRKLAVMEIEHPVDRAYFSRIDEVIQNYTLLGLSRTSELAIELYMQLDGIWFTVVIFRHSGRTLLNSVATMHRIDRRKVESRRR